MASITNDYQPQLGSEGVRDGLINSPEISPSGEPQVRAIKSIYQAREVVKTILEANRRRVTINTRIMAKYNAERPFVQKKLEAQGLGWKHNFTTKPLPMLVEKVAPRFTEAIHNLKYLTNASLPSDVPGATRKTEKFRAGITKMIRKRKGWRNLVEDIAQENALFGYTGVAWLDEFTWFPKHFKQNEFFVSDGTKQLVSTTQVCVLREVYLPHELFEQIKDREAAKMVGWDIGNTIQAINNASPTQLRNADGFGTNLTLDAMYQDMERELSVGSSYMAGAKVIVVYSLLVQEVDGKVSHYRLAGTSMEKVYVHEDRFDSMEECLAFFAFQKGNGTMHGSKGIGRDIYELAAMLDRTRNEVVDRLLMSGKTLFQGDPRQIHKFRMSVLGNACIVPIGWTFIDHKIDGNVEPFIKLDAYFGMLLNQLIGTTSMPQQIEGEAFRSPEAWKLLASREEEGRDVKLARFLEFFADMMSTMQKRICNEDSQETDAKEFQKQMLKIMSREELDMLAKQPIAETVKDLTMNQRQLIVQIANEKKGNPLYNQRALEEADLTARMDADFADKVLSVENDPMEEAEQMRQQQLELILLGQGNAVPVSARDNHAVHLKTLMPVVEQFADQLAQGQIPTAIFEAMVAHVTEHYTRADESGLTENDGVLEEVKNFIKQAPKILGKLRELDQQAAQLADQSDALAAEDAGMMQQ